MSADDAIKIANQWIEAYNAKDLEALRALCGDSIRMEHHNRNVVVEGPDAVIGLMEQFEAVVPDRKFHSTSRQFSDGQRVVTEQIWEATALADIPGFAGKDEVIRLELACVWTVKDGKIHGYDDYG